MAQVILPHVNGPAILKIGNPLYDATHLLAANYTQGSGTLDTPLELGISVDGVDFVPTFYDDPVMADTGGMAIPVDLQDMLVAVTVRYQLVIYDNGILQALRLRGANPIAAYNAGGGAPIGEGTLAQAGQLVGANLYTHRLLILGTDTDSNNFADAPVRLFNCLLRGAQPVKVGTRRKIWQMEHFCWALIGNASSSTGKILYDHTNA